MTGVGLPVTSHSSVVGWFNTTDTLAGVWLSRTSGGTTQTEGRGQKTSLTTADLNQDCPAPRENAHRWPSAGTSSQWSQRRWPPRRHTRRCPAETRTTGWGACRPPGWTRLARYRIAPDRSVATWSPALGFLRLNRKVQLWATEHKTLNNTRLRTRAKLHPFMPKLQHSATCTCTLYIAVIIMNVLYVITSWNIRNTTQGLGTQFFYNLPLWCCRLTFGLAGESNSLVGYSFLQWAIEGGLGFFDNRGDWGSTEGTQSVSVVSALKQERLLLHRRGCF